MCIGIAIASGIAHGITLEEATYMAIENSPNVRQALAKYREGIENAEISYRSGLYPKIDLSAGLGHETTFDYNQTGEDVSLVRRELSLSLEQPLFDGFMSKYDTRRLREENEADRWEALIAVENTALEVAEAYANVLRHRELVDLANINLDTHQRIYEQIKLKSNAGVGRQSDLSQITARVAKAQANRLSAVNNLRDAESVYKKLVGELPPPDMIYPVPDRDLLPKTLDEAIVSAMEKNPAIEGAKWDTKATESFKLATESNKYPSVNFVLEKTFNNNLDGSEGPSEDLIAMVRLNYNIYKGNTDKRRYEVAVQQNIQASEIQRNTTRETELTVRLAWAAYEATLASKEYLREYVIATKESQIAYENQFRLGRRTLLDVLDSENELFQARQDYVNADYDELFSEFRLFNAKGELMRAFRIYRPPVLGFADEFEEDMPAPIGQSPIEELKAAETPVVAPAPTPSATKPQATATPPAPAATPNPADEVLFLDATEEGGAW
ncbi:TolC family outer membrane protein [Maribrevibacterium harenarium]|uniref:TolC family outer membrane protein n=2 Tax=Maribrevibacterium harenarium TaxID=2589817 RepID=A0A501WZ74_9GAMM|nr:TolC family outer membrane protein [Maribrevibacterium harenarium]